MDKTLPLVDLLAKIRQCSQCLDLPLGPRPVLHAAESATILVIGQTPGTRVHATGIPWNDPSGDRLRAWMAIDRETFYDSGRIAIVPMGFCYPGKGQSGDLPPRTECAPLWHGRLIEHMPHIRLTLLIGQYAQRYYLGASFSSVTEVVRHFADQPEPFFPLVHPSPRNRRWLLNNPWFEGQVIPALRQRIDALLERDASS